MMPVLSIIGKAVTPWVAETPGVAAGHVQLAGLFKHEGSLAAQSDRDDHGEGTECVRGPPVSPEAVQRPYQLT